jgi:pseudouridine-5'-phosphate glycosidase
LSPATDCAVSLSITEAMEKALEKERKIRESGTIPETVRVVPGECLVRAEN